MKRALIAGAIMVLSGPALAEEPQAFLGATVTSNYLLDGLTQTQDGPAFQPYLEVEFPPGFYIGAWLSNVDFGDGTDRIETDLYLGFRGETALFAYDLTYFRYYYDETGFCCEEFVAEVDFPIYGPVSGSVGYYNYFNSSYAVSAGFGLALPADFSLSGLYKTDGSGDAWDIGVSRALTDTISADLRYHDASYADPTVAVSLNWDARWNDVFGLD